MHVFNLLSHNTGRLVHCTYEAKSVGLRFESALGLGLGLGLCSKEVLINFAHFPLLMAWLDITYDMYGPSGSRW